MAYSYSDNAIRKPPPKRVHQGLMMQLSVANLVISTMLFV